jgi:hypothetical protein
MNMCLRMHEHELMNIPPQAELALTKARKG